MAYKLRCPKCKGTFPWDVLKGFPDECQLCGEYISNKDNDDIAIPAFLSARTKRADNVYRDTERGSEKRVELAAQAAGCSPEDMSALKITDMNDRRDAEIAAKSSEEAKQRLQSATPAPIGYQSNGAEFAAGTATGAITLNGKITTGIEPRAGDRARQSVQRAFGR